MKEVQDAAGTVLGRLIYRESPGPQEGLYFPTSPVLPMPSRADKQAPHPDQLGPQKPKPGIPLQYLEAVGWL